MTGAAGLLRGARFVFERLDVGPEGARYAVTVAQPEGTSHAHCAFVGEDITWSSWDRAPGAWAETTLAGLARTLATHHAHDASWPRSIARWRAPR